MDKVFAFMYNPMIEESAYATVSLHRTRRGAEMAMEFHRNEVYKEWKEIYPYKEEEPYEFGTFESWIIAELNVAE